MQKTSHISTLSGRLNLAQKIQSTDYCFEGKGMAWWQFRFCPGKHVFQFHQYENGKVDKVFLGMIQALQIYFLKCICIFRRNSLTQATSTIVTLELLYHKYLIFLMVTMVINVYQLYRFKCVAFHVTFMKGEMCPFYNWLIVWY